MEIFLAVLGVLAVLALVQWIGFRTWRGIPADRSAPPLALVGAERIPVLGVVVRLRNVVRDPVGLTLRCFEAHGSVFTLRIPFYKKPYFDLTYLASKEGYERVLELDPKVGTLGFVLGNVPTVGLWFPREPRDDESLQRLVLAGRRFLGAQILAEGWLDSALETARSEVLRHAEDWDGSVDLSEAFVVLVHDVCGRCFGGEALWDDAGAELQPLFRRIADGIDVVRVTLALNHPIKSRLPEFRASRALEAVLAERIAEHARTGRYPLLDAIRALQVEDEALTEANVPWMFMYVLWNALTYPGSYGLWTLTDILARPELVEALRQEQDRSKRLELLKCCFLETARLNPVSSLPRMLSQPIDFESEGRCWRIPAGGYVAASPGVLNRGSEDFPEPDRWDPQRHLSDESTPPYVFGHGPFSCVARAFVLSVVPAVLDTLLQGWDLKLEAPPPERTVRVHLTYSEHPIRASVRRRGSAASEPASAERVLGG